MHELPKDVLKMASVLILPSGLAGHRRQLCNVSLLEGNLLLMKLPHFKAFKDGFSI